MKVLKANKDFNRYVISLNTNEQLWEEGVNISGKSLGVYAYDTIHGTRGWKGKIEKGLRYDHVTLFDTGVFYKSFKLVLTSGFDLQITAKDVNGLEDIYGKVIGWTDENYQLIIKRAKEILKEYIEKELQQFKQAA